MSSPRFELKFTTPEAAQLYSNKLAPSTAYSAGYDLRITEAITLQPNERGTVGTGVALSMMDAAYVAKIYPRSGLSTKQGIVLGNLVGVIDADYQGEIKACLWNTSNVPVSLPAGERFCQMIFEHVVHPELVLVDEFSNSTERGDGGFGSTGSK
jgi:dUTP pyrophosphatase